jgi:hypothetical protein
MTGMFDLLIDARKTAGADIVLSANLHGEHGEDYPCVYRIPAQFEPFLTDQSDPFLIGFLFLIMQLGRPVRVRGRVSPSLLRNLDEYMSIWSAWRPKKYRWVPITADVEAEAPSAHRHRAAVTAFSGGVDSCFTAWRHRNNLAGRRNLDIGAGLFVHGFDIPLASEDSYARAREKNIALLDSIGLKLITMATSNRGLPTYWNDSHGATAVSCMALLQGGFETGLVASTIPYELQGLIWGSNPWTDRLLSSDSFCVENDGADCTRLEKVREISNWPEALQKLRVCWEGPNKHENCCRCEKCIRTILEFRANKVSQPPAFPAAVSDAQIRCLRLSTRTSVVIHERLYRTALERGLGNESWVKAMRTSLRRSRIRSMLSGMRRQWSFDNRLVRSIRRRLKRLWAGSGTHDTTRS